MSRRIFPTWTKISLALLTGGLGFVPLAEEARAQEPAECLSDDPNAWPASSKPYFLIVVDTSGSMTACTNPVQAYGDDCPSNAPVNSCGFKPNRVNDAKCALAQTVQAFSGQVNFGLETFASYLSGCPAGACGNGCAVDNGDTCVSDVYNCTWNTFPNTTAACGNFPDCDSPNGNPVGQGPAAPNLAEGTWRNGGNIVVPIKRDAPGVADNTDEILQWFDGQCGNNREIFAAGSTPIGGSLRSALQYFRAGWTRWNSGGTPTGNYCAPTPTYTFGTPMVAADRACRSLNVLLVTDGDDTCDGQAGAVAAAAELYNTGVVLGGKTWRVRTHVINFAGGIQANTDDIADAGDDGNSANNSATSYFATNEATLASALSQIISQTVAPEVCDNTDNNCNGCTDEGYRHYCNKQQTCCAGNRDDCLEDYEDSITAADPDGDLTLLPCVDQPASLQPSTWLCFDPGETCDTFDNNCRDGSDENVLRCGSPAHCPRPETCDGADDDCDGVVDNGVCGGCVPQPEICDGCDNDCDGRIDEGVAPTACGVANPPSCQGTRTCSEQLGGPFAPGACNPPGNLSACSSTGNAEQCDGVDNDCDGVVDDGVPPRSCLPPGTPGGLSYVAPSQCRQGSQTCQSSGGYGPCIGFIGPSAEVCDGIDNDCNGTVDDDVVGANQECGLSGGECVPGHTECVNGALTCVDAIGGSPEVCDGEDNDCDGDTDEAPLADAPEAGETGCWTLAGNACTFENLQWGFPSGADCNSVGDLAAPCAAGTLVCQNGGGWACVNDRLPAAEACDGVDNDCNGQTDEGDFPGEGDECGDSDPPCEVGHVECANGFLACVGGVGPQPEVCDGIDNDCDLEIDEGVSVGASCDAEYDTVDYPGDRSNSPCAPGVLECNGDGGTVCVGAVGPSPEICDGIDNDCDGSVDETGDAPDGIDGSENPFPPPDAVIGDACGESEGVCVEGAYGCLNGRFECLGGQGPQVEVCDCDDNDCDGTNDNANPNDTPRLCGAGKDCVKSGDSCQCAQPCGDGEFPCPAGQTCQQVTLSETGEELGGYCVQNFCEGGCADKTVRDANDTVLCAPRGTSLPDCRVVPECECKGQSGCQPPCFGVQCPGDLTCASFGEAAGTCAPNNCFNVGCQGCDSYCSGTGDCVANPCADPEANDCNANQGCEPDGKGEVDCFGSCAGVQCDSGEVCKGGECVADCSPACSDDQVCDYTQTPATCVENQCGEDACPNGGCCDPLTGACGTCPCEGIICPDSQVCVDDECIAEVDPTGTGGAAATSTGAGGQETGAVTGTGTTTGAGGSGGNGNGSGPGGVFGLATGGGGCQCEVGAGTTGDGAGKLAALVAVGLAVGLRRRRREASATRGRVAGEEVSR